jgi:hypothetical protein
MGAVLLVVAVLLPTSDPARAGAAGGGGDPAPHLAAILDVSRPPEYRRFGSPGMAAAADHAASALAGAGYAVLRHDRPSTVWSVDYAPGHEPSLVRVDDGTAFRTESAFQLGATTPVEGITCTVRPVEEVTPGDCGFVPYEQVSPEWNNLLADVATPVRTIAARGGVAAILEGDREHDALIALRVQQAIPVVVSLVEAGAVLGREVRVRAMGAEVPTTLRNVVAVRPPADPADGYVVLQGHLDGWFEAAADNGGGAAAVLAAAERLAGGSGRRGLLVALYDGEEWGLRGSRAFVDDLSRPEGLAIGACGPVVHLHDLVAVVNLDVPSAIASELQAPLRDATGLLLPLVSWRVLVASEEPTVAALLAATMAAAGVVGLPATAELAEPINGGVRRSDTRWFHEAGIPIAWPVVGYPEYHTEADRLETIDPVDLTNVTTGAVSLVRALEGVPIARLPGSVLAAPGTGATGTAASCVATTTTTATDPAAGEGPAGAIPATGRGVALAPAAALLLVALALRALVARRS